MSSPNKHEVYRQRMEKLKAIQSKLQNRRSITRKPNTKQSKAPRIIETRQNPPTQVDSVMISEPVVLTPPVPVPPVPVPPPATPLLPVKEDLKQQKDEIVLDVVQGLGDIFWIYQKMAPFYQKIHMNICAIHMDKIQGRSLSWMPLFPKIGNVKLRLVKSDVYSHMAQTKYDLLQTIKDWDTQNVESVPYAVNRWLEEGVRIDEIDQHPIEKTVELKTEPVAIPFEKYLTLYVSGGAKNRNLPCWSIEQWLNYIDIIYSHYKIDLPIVVIGADFDKAAMDDVNQGLKDRKMQSTSFMGESPAKVSHIIKNGKFFIGYQSGLNIIADNFDVPQVMLYYDNLKPMLYTWCKKENVKTKFFADLFSNSPKKVAKNFDLSKFF